jgi:membrane protein YdbS with pleckstrin-like domain
MPRNSRKSRPPLTAGHRPHPLNLLLLSGYFILMLAVAFGVVIVAGKVERVDGPTFVSLVAVLALAFLFVLGAIRTFRWRHDESEVEINSGDQDRKDAR